MAEVNSSQILGIWRALSGNEARPGWRSIALLEVGECRVRAARSSPGNEEAILLGFPTIKPGVATSLPKGQGFRVDKAHLAELGESYSWLALVRQSAGSLELFAAVASDLVRLLALSHQMPEKQIYQKVLGRVRSWQEFMRKGREGLSAEAELGLMGELVFLKMLIEEGMPLYSAMDAWQGPHHGLHDFLLASGGAEVKTTLATEGFPVKIMSLEQLDDSQTQPLYLAGIRLSVAPDGMTLPEWVGEIRSAIGPDQAAASRFESALLAAGYLDLHAESYPRRFVLSEMKVLPVCPEFPKFTPFNTHSAVKHAQYELDLTMIPVEPVTLTEMLSHVGEM